MNNNLENNLSEKEGVGYENISKRLNSIDDNSLRKSVSLLDVNPYLSAIALDLQTKDLRNLRKKDTGIYNMYLDAISSSVIDKVGRVIGFSFNPEIRYILDVLPEKLEEFDYKVAKENNLKEIYLNGAGKFLKENYSDLIDNYGFMTSATDNLSEILETFKMGDEQIVIPTMKHNFYTSTAVAPNHNLGENGDSPKIFTAYSLDLNEQTRNLIDKNYFGVHSFPYNDKIVVMPSNPDFYKVQERKSQSLENIL